MTPAPPALTPELRKQLTRKLRAAVALARSRAIERNYGWSTFDLGPWRVSVRALSGRLGHPVQIMATARRPLRRADIEAIAEMAGFRYFSTDEFPGNQHLITEARLATVKPHDRRAGAQASA